MRKGLVLLTCLLTAGVVFAGDTTESVAFEFDRRNCDLKTVIGELEESGVEITDYESRDGLHYVMLIYGTE